ncbi:MAG: hypothetical protein KJ950_03720 [Proteobacteria bacterium]|nr:hypothetical protein [Pseudomonadota bacterium]MBU1688317.1 hypothetical protein [Pseudomonadota bacterium]
MDNIFQEIKQIPLVMGSYIHIKGITTIHSDLPKIFLGKVQEIGHAMDRVIKVNDATRMQANNFEIQFEEAIIHVRQIDHDASLIIFCESGVNRKLLGMTTGMLSHDILTATNTVRRGGAAPTPEAPKAAAPPPPRPTPAPTPKKIDVNQIIHASPLAKIFQSFQEGLALAIGPISEMVMKDSIEKWAKKGDISENRLTELVIMLCQEIDDPELENEFKLHIAPILP